IRSRTCFIRSCRYHVCCNFHNLDGEYTRWIINLFRLLFRCITLKTRLHAASPVFNSKHTKKLKSSSSMTDRRTNARKSQKIRQNWISEFTVLHKRTKVYQRREIKEWSMQQERSFNLSMRMIGFIKR